MKKIFLRGMGWVVVLSFFMTGCYGKFLLTRELYKANGRVEDKYVRSAVAWLLLFPYGGAAFIDFAVFNLIEFWTGKNPMVAGDGAFVRVERGEDLYVRSLANGDSGTEVRIDYYHRGEHINRFTIREEEFPGVTGDLFSVKDKSHEYYTIRAVRGTEVMIEHIDTQGERTVQTLSLSDRDRSGLALAR